MVQGPLRNSDFEQLEGNGKSLIGGEEPSQEYNSCTFDKDIFLLLCWPWFNQLRADSNIIEGMHVACSKTFTGVFCGLPPTPGNYQMSWSPSANLIQWWGGTPYTSAAGECLLSLVVTLNHNTSQGCPLPLGTIGPVNWETQDKLAHSCRCWVKSSGCYIWTTSHISSVLHVFPFTPATHYLSYTSFKTVITYKLFIPWLL